MSDASEALKLIDGKIDQISKASIEAVEIVYKAAWNEAIEAAAKVAKMNEDDYNIHGLIRKLKK